MKQLSPFNAKLDKNPIPLSELIDGQLILAKVKLNAKTIVFRPCWIVSAEPVSNTNDFPVMRVRIVNGKGTVQDVRLREQDGVTVALDVISNPTKVNAWVYKDIVRMKKEKAALDETMTRYANLFTVKQ